MAILLILRFNSMTFIIKLKNFSHFLTFIEHRDFIRLREFDSLQATIISESHNAEREINNVN